MNELISCSTSHTVRTSGVLPELLPLSGVPNPHVVSVHACAGMCALPM